MDFDLFHEITRSEYHYLKILQKYMGGHPILFIFDHIPRSWLENDEEEEEEDEEEEKKEHVKDMEDRPLVSTVGNESEKWLIEDDIASKLYERVIPTVLPAPKRQQLSPSLSVRKGSFF